MFLGTRVTFNLLGLVNPQTEQQYLLFISNENVQHYCLNKNMICLLASQTSNKKVRYVCKAPLQS